MLKKIALLTFLLTSTSAYSMGSTSTRKPVPDGSTLQLRDHCSAAVRKHYNPLIQIDSSKPLILIPLSLMKQLLHIDGLFGALTPWRDEDRAIGFQIVEDSKVLQVQCSAEGYSCSLIIVDSRPLNYRLSEEEAQQVFQDIYELFIFNLHSLLDQYWPSKEFFLSKERFDELRKKSHKNSIATQTESIQEETKEQAANSLVVQAETSSPASSSSSSLRQLYSVYKKSKLR